MRRGKYVSLRVPRDKCYTKFRGNNQHSLKTYKKFLYVTASICCILAGPRAGLADTISLDGLVDTSTGSFADNVSAGDAFSLELETTPGSFRFVNNTLFLFTARLDNDLTNDALGLTDAFTVIGSFDTANNPTSLTLSSGDIPGNVDFDGVTVNYVTVPFLGNSFSVLENGVSLLATANSLSSETELISILRSGDGNEIKLVLNDPIGGDFIVDFAAMVPNNAVLTLTQVLAAASVVPTENQASLVEVFDTLLADPNLTEDEQTLITALASLPPGALQEALEDLSGDGYGSLSDISQSDIESVLDILSTRFGITLGSGFASGPRKPHTAFTDFQKLANSFSLGFASPGFAQTQSNHRPLLAASNLSQAFSVGGGWSAWVEGYGVFGELEGGLPGIADTDYTVFGSTVGIDYTFAGGFLAGLSIGYASSDTDVDTRQTNIDGDSVRVSAYGGAKFGTGYLAGSVSYATTGYVGRRAIPFLGVNASSEFESDEITGYVEGAYGFNTWSNTVFEPAVSLRLTNLDLNGYVETGAGAANLTIADRSLTSIESSLGARIRKPFDMQGDVKVLPELRTFFNYEFDETDRVVDASLVGSGFTVLGAEAPRATATIGGGLGVLFAEKAKFFVNYDAELAQRLTEHTIAGSFRWGF